MGSSSLDSWNDLATHVVPLPNNISFFIAGLLVPTALLIPPSVLSHRTLYLLFLPLIYALILRSSTQIGGLDVLSVDLALWTFHLLYFRDPRKSFKRVRMRRQMPPRTQSSEITTKAELMEYWEEAYPRDFYSRIPWVLSLVMAFRFTNWKIGEPRHDRAQPYKGLSRRAYLKSTFIEVLRSYLLLDLAASYVQTDPYFFQPINLNTPFPPSNFTTPTALKLLRLLPPWIIRASVFGAQLYSSVVLMFVLPGLPAVAIGVLPEEWSPNNWPSFFGSFSTLTDKGLRGLWGSFWHQTTKQIGSAPGRAFNQSLGISTSSTAGYETLVAFTFFLTGVIHIGLVPPQPLTTEVSVNKIRFYMASFFWVQSIGIGIELLLLRLFRSINPELPSLVTSALILSWIVAWISITLPLLALPFRELKYWHAYPVPVSPVQGLLGNGWFPWSPSRAVVLPTY